MGWLGEYTKVRNDDDTTTNDSHEYSYDHNHSAGTHENKGSGLGETNPLLGGGLVLDQEQGLVDIEMDSLSGLDNDDPSHVTLLLCSLRYFNFS